MAVAIRKKEVPSRLEVADQISRLGHQLGKAQNELGDVAKEHEHEVLMGGSKADSLATTVVMAERRVEALSKELDRLENVVLPEAVAAEEADARRNAYVRAQRAYAKRLRVAEALVKTGAEFDALWAEFVASEREYETAVGEADLQPKPISNVARVTALSNVVPAAITEVSTLWGNRVLLGEGPVQLVRKGAPEKLSRMR